MVYRCDAGKQYSSKFTIYMNKTYYKKRSCQRFEKENTGAQHSDFILISFLLPVIAQSGEIQGRS